jgi:anti-sigma factor RsiW
VSCQEFREAAAIDALGALEADERAELVAHLDRCPACAAYRSDLERLPPVLDLAASAPQDTLPPGLEERIVRTYMADAAPRRRRRVRRLVPALAGLAVGVAATLAIVQMTADHASHTLSVALRGTTVAPGAFAVAHLEPAATGTVIHLDVSHLPASNAREHYEVWLSDGADGISAGTFRVGADGAAVGTLTCAGAPGEYATLDVTVERDDAPRAAPRTVVMTGTIPRTGA